VFRMRMEGDFAYRIAGIEDRFADGYDPKSINLCNKRKTLLWWDILSLDKTRQTKSWERNDSNIMIPHKRQMRPILIPHQLPNRPSHNTAKLQSLESVPVKVNRWYLIMSLVLSVVLQSEPFSQLCITNRRSYGDVDFCSLE